MEGLNLLYPVYVTLSVPIAAGLVWGATYLSLPPAVPSTSGPYNMGYLYILVGSLVVGASWFGFFGSYYGASLGFGLGGVKSFALGVGGGIVAPLTVIKAII